MHYSPRFVIAGLVFDIPTMIMTVVTSLVVILFVLYLSRKLSAGVPNGRQNVLEWVIDFVTGIAGNFMDAKTATKFVTLAFTLFLYIFIGNQLGVVLNVNTSHHNAHGHEMSESVKEMLTVSGKEEDAQKKLEHLNEELNDPHGHVVIAWWKSPTATPSVTFALAFLVLIYSHILGIRKSAGGWFKNVFLNPIHLLEELIIKPLTMPLRLFGNIFAGEVLIAFLLGTGVLIGTLPMIAWLGYSLFVGSVQAFIFVTLAMVYISQQVNDHH